MLCSCRYLCNSRYTHKTTKCAETITSNFPADTTTNTPDKQYNIMNIITAKLGPMQRGKYPFFFITDLQGRGYIIHLLTNWLKSHKQKYMLLAPTGVAAQNIGGPTIHSTLRLSQSPSGFQSLALHDLPQKGTISNTNNYYRLNFNGFSGPF